MNEPPMTWLAVALGLVLGMPPASTFRNYDGRQRLLPCDAPGDGSCAVLVE